MVSTGPEEGVTCVGNCKMLLFCCSLEVSTFEVVSYVVKSADLSISSVCTCSSLVVSTGPEEAVTCVGNCEMLLFCCSLEVSSFEVVPCTVKSADLSISSVCTCGSLVVSTGPEEAATCVGNCEMLLFCCSLEVSSFEVVSCTVKSADVSISSVCMCDSLVVSTYPEEVGTTCTGNCKM